MCVCVEQAGCVEKVRECWCRFDGINHDLGVVQIIHGHNKFEWRGEMLGNSAKVILLLVSLLKRFRCFSLKAVYSEIVLYRIDMGDKV